MPPFLEELWAKTPDYIKWPVCIGIFAYMVPLKIRREVISLIHQEVYAVITPLKDQRDAEILTMKGDIATIKSNTKEIHDFILYGKKPTAVR